MKKIVVDGTVKVRVYNYVDEKMEDAIAYGYMRAYKHTDTPTEDQVKYEIHNSIMNSLCDIFVFGEDEYAAGD
jgi:hypothetical protein